MLNILVEFGVENSRTCGLWVNGFKCTLFTMDLCYNGVYRFIEVGNFELPKCMNDIIKTRAIITSLLKIRDIVDDTKKNIKNIIRWKKDRLVNVASKVDWDLIPNQNWKRKNCGVDNWTKKQKKNACINSNHIKTIVNIEYSFFLCK
ncbi:unnamed protein product [Cunninghamella blakesleeana]